jgi:hypothetical protein
VDNPLGLRGGRRQRLFTQHGLAGAYRGQHEIGVGAVVRGDDDGLDEITV